MAASRRNPNMAIPLCLPNNYRWNASTGECSKTGEKRSSLVIVDEALQKLKILKGKPFRNWPLLYLQQKETHQFTVSRHIFRMPLLVFNHDSCHHVILQLSRTRSFEHLLNCGPIKVVILIWPRSLKGVLTPEFNQEIVFTRAVLIF